MFHLLDANYNIIQGIHAIIKTLPTINVNIFHIKAHQDQHKPFDDLTPYAKMNVHANHHATTIHHQHQSHVGTFPSWLPGTWASLFHENDQVTSGIPDYI
jgi:hypothetical protein